jgi:hypothetical protein
MRSALLAAAGLTAVLVLSNPVEAGGLYAEHAHVDSFGNLVIHAPGGYKRILVGRGKVADGATVAAAPRKAWQGEYRRTRPCARYGVRLHGRSYMYGLPDNLVPVLSHCPG